MTGRSGLHLRGLLLALGILASGFSSLAADSFTFSADKVQSILATGKERTILSGKARVKSDRIAITADSIEIVGKDSNLLVCRGSVVADDEEKGIHLEAPYLTYDRKKSFALLQGPSILEDRKNRVVLKADWIQDDGDAGITLAQVNVRILKKGLACRSEYAIYRRGDHVLELSGAPRVVKDGDEYKAARMVVNTDTEEISLEGAVSGVVHTDESGTTAGAPAAKSGTEAPAAPGVEATTPAPAPAPSGGTQP